VVKTKFDTIVKLKKSQLDKIDREISKIDSQLHIAKTQLNSLIDERDKLEYPKSGNFFMISQFKMILNAKLLEIETKKEEIEFLKNQKKILLSNLKEANIEYEKMKYLQAEEIKMIIKNKKQQEIKELDEIALMLYKGEK